MATVDGVTTQLPSYSTQVNSIDVDSFSNEDVQSFFNVDWGGGQKRAKQTPVDDLIAKVESPQLVVSLPVACLQ